MTKKTRAKARRALLTLSLVLVVAFAAVGGTIAWLTDKTTDVVNTFTPSNIDIELVETTGSEYKMVPNAEITKDPKVTVKGGSEAAWVFVKIVESDNYDTYMEDYNDEVLAASWKAVSGATGVYYREVNASDTDQEFAVINGNKVEVKENVTNAMMVNAATDKPALTFTAYAIQKESFTTAEAAWAEAQNATIFAKQ